jgi:hypothetical protein
MKFVPVWNLFWFESTFLNNVQILNINHFFLWKIQQKLISLFQSLGSVLQLILRFKLFLLPHPSHEIGFWFDFGVSWFLHIRHSILKYLASTLNHFPSQITLLSLFLHIALKRFTMSALVRRVAVLYSKNNEFLAAYMRLMSRSNHGSLHL